MNQKIQSLIDGGFISINDVLEHSGYLENQIDDYYHEQYNMELDQQEHERMMESQDMYGSEWESNDPNAPDYEDTQDVEWPTHTRSSSPEYIIASTSYKLEETYVFEANEDGKILDLGEYGGIAKRWEDLEWVSYYAAVDKTFGEGRYQFVRRVESGSSGVMHMLFKRLELSEADFWDGDCSDLFLQ